jgi:hypothetical protein
MTCGNGLIARKQICRAPLNTVTIGMAVNCINKARHAHSQPRDLSQQHVFVTPQNSEWMDVHRQPWSNARSPTQSVLRPVRVEEMTEPSYSRRRKLDGRRLMISPQMRLRSYHSLTTKAVLFQLSGTCRDGRTLSLVQLLCWRSFTEFHKYF